MCCQKHTTPRRHSGPSICYHIPHVTLVDMGLISQIHYWVGMKTLVQSRVKPTRCITCFGHTLTGRPIFTLAAPRCATRSVADGTTRQSVSPACRTYRNICRQEDRLLPHVVYRSRHLSRMHHLLPCVGTRLSVKLPRDNPTGRCQFEHALTASDVLGP